MSLIETYESPQWTIHLKYPDSDELHSSLNFTRVASEGLFLLVDGLFVPLKADLSIDFFDQEFDYPVGEIDPPQQFWLLKQENLPENISADTYWVAKKEHLVSAINQKQLSDFIQQAIDCNQKNDLEYSVNWHQLIFNANRCQLPLAPEMLVEGCVHVTERTSHLQLPVESIDGKIWISGPLKPYFLYAPIEIFFERDMGEISLQMQIYWTIYTEDGSPGKQKVQENIDKLLAKGWVMTEG